MHFCDRRYSSQQIAEVLEYLYGSSDAPIEEPRNMECQEHIFKLIGSRMSTKEVRAIMMLMYGVDKALSKPTTEIVASKPEPNNALANSADVAHEERTTPNDDGYVTVDPRGEGNIVSNAVRLNTSVVMVSSAGYTLNTPENCSCRVELNDIDEELVTITSADNSSKCLVLNSFQQWVFGCAELALKFKTMVSSTGQLVLVESSTDCVLETELQGDSKLVVCRNKYSAEAQSWTLCTVYGLDACSQSPATSEMQHTPAISDATGRRHLIMQLLLVSRKWACDVSEILELLYGTSSPLESVIATEAICLERQQFIFKLLEAGHFSRLVKILTMLYGTAAPLVSKLEMDDSSAVDEDASEVK